ncbi:BTB/POZ domain-containing protein 8 [Holothuria leucospilota]|uniref:BTB/POZ domain-containing protein 8 n=1 Tax=Holothuria leucospilota TaxID=206669 RepID=A0A9Q1H2N9_HOLLE|nr:BTB/POZ domain-containing protein 8 [Holothuria leucospilota]
MAKQVSSGRGLASNPLQSASYISKVSKEKLKVDTKLLEQFSNDIHRALKEEILVDVHFTPSSDPSTTIIKCHSALLKRRLPSLWEKCSSCCTFQEGSENRISAKNLAMEVNGISDIIQSVYTCSSNLLEEKWNSIRNKTEAVTEDTTESERTECSSLQDVENGVSKVSFEEKTCHRKVEEDPNPLRIQEDLARCISDMRLNGEDADIVLELDNKESFPAHRFVLSCRSRFFEAMFTGSWRESSANRICLPGISQQSLTVILDHIYGGTAGLPESCNLRELAQHADMWEIPSLKDCIIFHLKHEYCHLFHKPCTGCSSGVLDSLIFSCDHNYSFMKESCLRWIHRYMARCWSQKSFSTLPEDIIDLCYTYSVDQLSLDSCIAILTDVEKLINNLPSVKWAEYVRPVCQRLFDDTMHFTAQNFTHPAVQRHFRSLLEGLRWNEPLVKSLFNKIIEQLNPETAPNVLMLALQLEEAQKYDGMNVEASNAINEFSARCHSYIARNLGKVQYSVTWCNVPAAVQQKLKKDAVFVDDRGPVKTRPVLSSSLRKDTVPRVAKGT